jgi:hypothetical protein
MSILKITAYFYSGKKGNTSVVIYISLLCPDLVSGKDQSAK